MNFDELHKLARARLDELAEAVIGEFKTLDIEECGQAPDDLGLLTMWDEFKEQQQHGDSFFIELYKDTFHRFTHQQLEGELACDLAFLWGGTDAAINFDWELENCLCHDELRADIANAVYGRICARAGNEEIEYRPGYGPDGEEDSEEEDEEGDAPEAQSNVSEAKAEVPGTPTDIPAVKVEVPEANAEISNGQMSLFDEA